MFCVQNNHLITPDFNCQASSNFERYDILYTIRESAYLNAYVRIRNLYFKCNLNFQQLFCFLNSLQWRFFHCCIYSIFQADLSSCLYVIYKTLDPLCKMYVNQFKFSLGRGGKLKNVKESW